MTPSDQRNPILEAIETFEWCGITKYRCKVCTYDADALVDVKSHVYYRHMLTGQLPDAGDGVVMPEEPAIR